MEPVLLKRGPVKQAPAALMAFLLFLTACQDRLLYHPEKEMAGTPADAGLRYSELFITAPDGTVINAWWVPAGNKSMAVLFCHGNAGNISHRLDTVRILHGMGLGVCLFDYRGYGKSGGRPSEEGTYRDADAVWKHMTTALSVPPERVIIMGRSLGASVAAWLARRKRPPMLIVESGFYSLKSLARDYCRLCPAGIMLSYRYETGKNAAAAGCPVLVVHSPDDEIIPFAHGLRIFNELKGERRFLEIRGSHNAGFILSGDTYRSGLMEFINRYRRAQ